MFLLPAIALAVVGMVALAGFLAIPYRIWVAHKAGDAEWGDYLFIVFLAYVVVTILLGLIFGWFK